LGGIGVCVAMLPFSAFATGSVKLAWNPSISTNVVGYRIYYGVTSGVYNTTISVTGSTNVTVINLIGGTTYYFAATAVDALGDESQFSNETTYSVPANSPPTPPVNTPPTLNPLSNVTINENAGSQTVNLGGVSSGATNEVQTLTVTAVSGNPSLIPNPTVNYTSPNATGTLNYTPVSGNYGTAIITVTVNDHGASNNIVSQSFTVTVNAANGTPTLDLLNNLVVVQNSGKQTVNLTGISSGLSNKTQTVTVKATSSNAQLIPTPTISYTLLNSYGSLSFTPAASSVGTSIISVTVNNGQKSNNIITRLFTITVVLPGSTAPQITSQPTNLVAMAGQNVSFSVKATGTGPLLYQWQFNSKILPSATNAVLQLNGVTTNQAGLYNVTVLNTVGTTNTAAVLTISPTVAATLVTVAPPSKGQFALNVNGVTGYNYVVQISTNMVNWASVLTNTAPFTFVDPNAGQYKQRFYRSFYLP